jgi:hypothetical protein
MARLTPFALTVSLLLVVPGVLHAQELYTARSYWEAMYKDPYRQIKHKQRVGDTLTDNEVAYLQDYETFLSNYYQRLPDSEKAKYEQMKAEWDRELLSPQKQPVVVEEEFEWRGRDRVNSFLYGVWYGTSLVLITNMSDAAALGVPLITGGLWVLGPVINQKKFEGITRPTLRAMNTGRFLGLIYGGALGMTIGGDSEGTENWIFGLSTLGSIGLGELGFQLQRRNNYSEGHIEMIRHYGILGPWLGISVFVATGSENVNLAGASLLAGGAAGLLVGNAVSKKYDYSKGDASVISSLTWISTGLGFTATAEALSNDGSSALFLIPAAGSVIGTVLGQKAVRGVHFTKRQGSTISYSSGGAALLGLGVVALTESESATVWVGVPSALALITHQILFSKYKRENLARGLQGRSHQRNSAFKLSMDVMPENYLLHQRMPLKESPTQFNIVSSNPLVKLKLSF